MPIMVLLSTTSRTEAEQIAKQWERDLNRSLSSGTDPLVLDLFDRHILQLADGFAVIEFVVELEGVSIVFLCEKLVRIAANDGRVVLPGGKQVSFLDARERLHFRCGSRR